MRPSEACAGVAFPFLGERLRGGPATEFIAVEPAGCRESGESKALLFNLCGHGHFDMQAYTDYLAGKLEAETGQSAEQSMALSGLPGV